MKMKIIILSILLAICSILISSCDYLKQSNNTDITLSNNITAGTAGIMTVSETTTKSNVQNELINYDEKALSYKTAKILYGEYLNINDESSEFKIDWKNIINNDFDLYTEQSLVYPMVKVFPIDLNNDGIYELFINYNIPGWAMEVCFSVFSLKDNQLLLCDDIRGEYKIYKKRDKYVISFIEVPNHDTFYKFFELTDCDFEYDNDFYNKFWINYMDKNINAILFHADYWNTNNQYFSKIENMKTYFYEGDLEEQEKEFDENLKNYVNSMELCTDKFKPISIMKSDLKSFDTLVEALKPLDNYMEEDSENQTGNSDAK